MLEKYIEMLLETESDESVVYAAIKEYLDEEDNHAKNEK